LGAQVFHGFTHLLGVGDEIFASGVDLGLQRLFSRLGGPVRAGAKLSETSSSSLGRPGSGPEVWVYFLDGGNWPRI
jgi:hypothetical protein